LNNIIKKSDSYLLGLAQQMIIDLGFTQNDGKRSLEEWTLKKQFQRLFDNIIGMLKSKALSYDDSIYFQTFSIKVSILMKVMAGMYGKFKRMFMILRLV
jgi:hypothetical protein